jgi:hypothetical protein
MEIDAKLTIQALLTAAQVLVAIVVGWIAYHARQDAKRNSVAGNPESDAEHNEMFGELRRKHLGADA